MKFVLLLSLVFSLTISCNLKETEIKLTPPVPIQGNKLSCKSLIGQSIHKTSQEKSVTAETIKGTDEIAINFDDKKLKFISTAAVKVGITESAEFDVLINNSEYLLATYFHVTGTLYNVLILNKTTGFAIWSRARAEFWEAGYPEGDIYYFQCH